MATGVPKTRWGDQRPTGEPAPAVLGLSLTYPGKVPEGEVLAQEPAPLSLIWSGSEDARNALYYGDNLPVLAALLRDPAVGGRVKLVYIDPPFATNSVFQSRAQADAYQDLLVGPHYIEFLRRRLILLRELLAPDGSIYVHLDDNMAFHVKVIMDEVFGPKNFRNWITRKKCNPKNYTRRTYGNVSDYLLFYTKSDTYTWNRPVESWREAHAHKEYNCIEPETGRRYKKVPVHAPGVRNGATGQPWRGKSPPPGKHWQYPPATLDAMDARGEIYWSPTGNPRRKIYLDGSAGVPVQDIWLELRDVRNQNTKITGYPTEKNPELLARVIAASSDPGDLVLDCFAGSGTTLAVADRLGRRWIGVDNSTEAIATTLRRFARGTAAMGDFVAKPAPLFEQHRLDLGEPESTSITDFSLLSPQADRGALRALLADPSVPPAFRPPNEPILKAFSPYQQEREDVDQLSPRQSHPAN